MPASQMTQPPQDRDAAQQAAGTLDPGTDRNGAGEWFVVVIREPDGKLHGLSRRRPGPDARPFAGPWGAMTEDAATALADAFNADPREGGTAEVVELFRYNQDPEWPEELA